MPGYFFVAPGMPEDEREELRVAGTLVIADYPDGWSIEENFVEVLDESERGPAVGHLVFQRRGPWTTA